MSTRGEEGEGAWGGKRTVRVGDQERAIWSDVLVRGQSWAGPSSMALCADEGTRIAITGPPLPSLPPIHFTYKL